MVGLDQWTKALVQRHVSQSAPSRPLIPGVLNLTHVLNDGVAFGQLRGGGILLVLIAAAAVAGILIYRARLLKSGRPLPLMLWLGLALPMAGALGNSIDRLRQGRVIDFLQFGGILEWFPVFNVADTAITIGAGLLILHSLQGAEPEHVATPADPVTEPAEIAPAGDS